MNDRRSGGRRESDMEQSRQIGELIGTVAALKEAVDGHIAREDLEMDAVKQGLHDLQNDIALKLKTAETVFKTLKFLGLAVIAALTFKFGDVKALWFTFFG